MIQHLDPLVGNAVFARDEQRKQTLKAEHIPRIDERPAVDPAMQEVLRLLQQDKGFLDVLLLHNSPCGMDATENLALEPGRGARNHLRLTQTRFGIAHPREEISQLTALDLLRAILREKHVQRLPHVTERLSRDLGMFGESLRPRTRCRF